ncbi:hypothetical protein AWH56_026375 [Anaerobacillus isosaccharinicus]|uniref:YqgU-like 6-bladed beta-propeller domain-containing protein n=1 Tax=Anaerobacillus isosaccharinicus TaxID=1532552 RepID=A0A1S2M2P5_9BACI|nr:hypothetical protein [Anaerobacillus isosaccharinicus]MBA5585566.1 hypothetical protein [Anaerobacillus isosaccharinicus]QOY36121.1 hypothetical protein AWH56_026375 [Anaerobacillus isosaccharinicus]
MRKLYVILILIFLTSCNPPDEVLTGNNVGLHSSNLVGKSGVPPALTKQERLQSIGTNMYSFVSVNEWFDKETILYLTDENGVSIINKFEILTGEEEKFFQIDEPIVRLDANPDKSVFVIEVATINGQKEFYFLNKSGKVLYRLEDSGEELQLYWNPYKENELLIAVLLEDYSIKLLKLNLNTKRLTDFDFEHYYVQWINKNELAFLNWDMFSLSYYAPLYTYDIQKKQKMKLSEEIIAFFTSENYLLTISIEDTATQNSNYTFYDSNTKKILSKLHVPVLNTYSEQWWIPNHEFHENTFYFIKPNKSGDLFNYSEGYTLVSFQMDTGKTKEIVSLDVNYPMKLSPNGRWLLYGYQLEKIVDIKKKEVHSLIYW